MQVSIKGKLFEVCDQPADYWGWIAEGRYDNEWNVYEKYLKPEHTFIDLGAWVGAHSLFASTIAGKVIAVEPDPVAFAIAEKNLAGLDVHQLAVSDKQGTIKIGSGWLGASTTRVNPNAGGGIGAWVEGQTCEVACTPIRDFICDLPDPLFIKIDVEGSEEAILKDAGLFAERKLTVLIELHPFWWKDVEQTWKVFEVVKALYPNSIEAVKNTWVLLP